MSLSTAKMSVSFRSNVSAQRWESLAVLISCTFTRTASTLFCTLPSKMWATPSCLAISGRFVGALLYFCVEVREITFKSAIFDKRVRISSFKREHRDRFFHNRRGRARRFPQEQAEGSENRGKRDQPDSHSRPAHPSPTFLHGLELPRQCHITELIVIEVHHRDMRAMFYFAFTQIVQIQVPARVRHKVLCYML